MRNVVILLTILALSATTYAGTVTIAGDGSGGSLVLTLSYDGTDSTLAGVAVIVDGPEVTGYNGGTDSFFDVYIDEQADIVAGGGTLSDPLVNTTPLADPSAAGVATLPATAVSVCVGSLTGAAGPLTDIGLADIACAEGTYTVSGDTLRGVAVEILADGTVQAAATNLPITVDVSSGACLGDVSSATPGVPDGIVSVSDVIALIDLVNTQGDAQGKVDPIPAGFEAGDVSSSTPGVPDNVISVSDVIYIIDHINTLGDAQGKAPCIVLP